MISKPKTSVVIQARIGSTRFPAKSLAQIGDFKLIEWVLKRIKMYFDSNSITLAVPDTEENRILETFAINEGILFVTGPEDDVLTRFQIATRNLSERDFVIRVCADNPFISGKLLKNMSDYAISNDLEFVHSQHRLPESPYADGFGAEILRKEALEKISLLAITKNDREHVTIRAYDPDSGIKIHVYPIDDVFMKPYLKLDIDTKNDYLYIANCVKKYFLNPYSEDKGIIQAFQEEWTSAKK